MLISVIISNVKVLINANEAPQIPTEQPPLPPIRVKTRAYLDFMVFLIHQVLKRRLKIRKVVIWPPPIMLDEMRKSFVKKSALK
jgi:hypothetical protein